MIKVAIQTTALTDGHAKRGIGVYTQNLIAALKKRNDVSIIEFSNIQNVSNVDVIHFPYFDLFQHTLQINKNFPTVVTILDVAPLMFPRAYPPGIKGNLNLFLQKQTLKQVQAFITISEFAKKDVCQKLAIPAEKIFVTYLAASDEYKKITDPNLLKNIAQKYNLPEKFVLFVGNVNYNKNIVNLTQACIDAKIDLVIIGGAFLNKENLNHAEQRSFKQFLERFQNNPLVHLLGYVVTDDVVAITNLAKIFLFPSIYEGFGMPVLEAQKCQVPVITSKTTSLPEVVGEGALLVDPENVLEISQAIAKLLDDDQLCKKLIKKGLENACKFSWDKCAQQTMDVYAKVIAK